ncbi:hypothetical protein OC835_003905 [Tilletia horrida]|nr:hypothetical protein OC835_003905 [Tilletia horrida]
MPILGKVSASSLAAVASGSSDISRSHGRSSYSPTLHAAAAATAGDDPGGHGDAAGEPGRDDTDDDDGDAAHAPDLASETTPLLEAAGADGIDLVKTVEKQSVWPILHYVRRLVLNTIDTALSWDELTSVDLNFAIVRPLAHRLSRLKSIAIVYVLLLNKLQFGNDADKDLAYQQVNTTRAMLCELLAIKMLRTFSRDGIELVTALTAPFSPFAGADEGALMDLFLSNSSGDPSSGSGSGSPISTLGRKSGFLWKHHHRAKRFGTSSALSSQAKSSALELAILCRATKFLNSPLARRCVDGIWTGRVVISSHASHAIIEDSYKKRPLSIYDPNKAPVLDHYRLRVPLIRSRLEFLNFLILLVLFLVALQQRGTPTWTIAETVFTIWLAGFTLDEFAQMQEHGLGVYFSSLDNGLDALFMFICSFFLVFRITGLAHGDFARQELAFDCLALGAIVLCPRVASIFVADSVVLLSLKAMLADFVFFMSLAMVCFSGFWFTFWSLVEDRKTWTPGNILWTMLRICFFAGYVDLSVATTFSPIFGPPLFVIFAVVSNVMLLTILISSLSNTFTVVAMRADEEAAFQHACRSMAGISSDALFSYVPPLNLIGFAIILPCKFFLTERYLHKTHVFLVRSLSFPILLTIRLVERQSFKHGLELTAERGRRAFSWLPIIGSSRSREERELLEMVFSHEPSALTADADAFGGTLSGGAGASGILGGGSAIYSAGASTSGSAKDGFEPDDDDDHDDDDRNGHEDADDGDVNEGVQAGDPNTGGEYIEQVLDKVMQEGQVRSELVATLKERAKGDVTAAQSLEGEDSGSATIRPSPAEGSEDAAAGSERRQSQYGQHLHPSGPGISASPRGGSTETTASTSKGGAPSVEGSAPAPSTSTTKYRNFPRTRTRTTTGSSARSTLGAVSIPLAPEPSPSSPPPRGLGSLTSPLARFFGGGGGGGGSSGSGGGGGSGGGRHHVPSSRRAQRASAGPPPIPESSVPRTLQAQPRLPSASTDAPPPRQSSAGVGSSAGAGAGAGAGVPVAPEDVSALLDTSGTGGAFGVGTFNAVPSQAGGGVVGPTGRGGAAAAAHPHTHPHSHSHPHHHPQQHGLEDSPAARSLLKRMDKLEKNNEAMLELLRSLVAASSTKD